MNAVRKIDWRTEAVERSAPALRALTRPSRHTHRSSLPVVATISVVVVAAVQLGLGVVLADGAFHIDRLLTQKSEVSRTLTATTQDLVSAQSPQYLAANAEALGMVPNANPVYLRLSDNAVIGSPAAAPHSGSFPGSTVPNALLAGVPLATELEAQARLALNNSADTRQRVTAIELGRNVATPGVAPAPAQSPSVPLHNGIPTPQTH